LEIGRVQDPLDEAARPCGRKASGRQVGNLRAHTVGRGGDPRKFLFLSYLQTIFLDFPTGRLVSCWRVGKVARPAAFRGRGRATIRKLSSGGYRLYSRKKDPKTGRKRNLGTFRTRAAALRHERAVQYFKRAG
jgi:hypothetical protein